MKPLDFVKTPKKNLAIITEVNKTQSGTLEASIEYIGKQNPQGEHNAWWSEKELTVVDNLASLLARNLAHPFGNGEKIALKFYPKH